MCALMMDEMAIRKYMEYADGKFHEYVDVGRGKVDNSLSRARMHWSSWLLPSMDLGKFQWHTSHDGLSGQERVNIVTQCLQKLHEIGVRVVSLTCDGTYCLVLSTRNPPHLRTTHFFR